MAIFWRNAVLAISLLTILHLVNGSLIGIDFGTEWIEVALVKPRTFEVVLNEQSSRKTPAAVTFTRNGDLLLGTDAKNLLTRQPDSVATGFFNLLGRSWEHPFIEDPAVKPFYSYKLVNESGRYGFSIDENTVLIPEELAAILLRYLKEFASKAAAMSVKDCVITVPPFFNQQQRQAVLDSAKLSGLNVLSLLNQDAAIGLHFAMERLFTSAPPSTSSSSEEDEEGNDSNSTQFIIYDMGAAVTTVSLLNFKFTSDEKSKQQTGTLRVIDFAWDEKLGGRDFDRRLALHFVEMTKKLGGPDVSQKANPRAFAKLMKEAQRVKEILSANSESVVMVEGLTSEYDLKSSISREQFEALSGDLFERALVPLQTMVQRRNITLPSEDIDYVEIFGGGIRIPKLQQKIQEYIGRDVDRHINGDEGAVLGAAFYAATQSSSFKKSRTITVKDFIPWGLTASIKSDSGQVDSTTEVFKANSRYGSKKSVTFSTNDNFTVYLQYDEAAVLPAGTSRELGTFRVTGVPSMETYNMVAKPKIHITFRLNNHGMYVIERAEAEAVILLPPEPKKEEKKEVTEEATEETEAETSEEAEEEKTETEEPKEHEPIKRVHRVNLDVAGNTLGLTAANLAASSQKLVDIQRRAEVKKEKEREKNTLEAYIYETKEKLEGEEVLQVTTEKQREEFSTKLSEATEWLYAEGENTDAAEYRAKLKDLKVYGDKIFFRVLEMTERPKAVMQALYTVNLTRPLLFNISEVKNITEEELHDVVDQLDEFEGWIQTKLEEQSELQAYDEPVLTSRQINDKWAKIEKEVKRLLRKPEKKKPKPVAIEETPDAENTTESTEQPATEQSEEDVPQSEPEHSEEDAHPDHTHDEL